MPLPPTLTQQNEPSPPPAAATQLLRAALAMLAQKLGQMLEGTVLATTPGGLTQLRLGGETLTVRLPQPLPAGTLVEVRVQMSAEGMPVLALRPVTAPVPATPPPPTMPRATMPPQPSTTPTTVATPMVLARSPATAAPTAAPTPATPLPPGGLAAVRPAPAGEAAAQSAAPVSAPTPTIMSGGATRPAAVPAPPIPAGPVPSAMAGPLPPAAEMMAVPAVNTPTVTTPAAPALPPVLRASTGSVPAAVPPGHLMQPGSVPSISAASAPSAVTAPVAPTPVAAPPDDAVTSRTTAPTPAQWLAAAVPKPAAPYAMVAAPARSVQPVAVTGAVPQSAPAPRTPLTPPVPPLASPAQVAARQDSVLPLLQNLHALQVRLAELPRSVTEPAMRLLAARLPVERSPSGEALRRAVEGAGVLAPASTRSAAPPGDVKLALLQLRAGLLAMLAGEAIAPIAPIGRRPLPPLPDAEPRGFRTDGPTLPPDAGPKDTARTLLHQTDAALSRLKLTQLASQPSDAARAAAAAPDFVVELPMQLNSELGLAQLRIDREGKSRARTRPRGWRVRFAVHFAATGEVGAQVSLLGRTTNVVLWAAEEATADALEAMLPELTPALAAHGLEVGSVRLRRGPPVETRPAAGRLVDATR